MYYPKLMTQIAQSNQLEKEFLPLSESITHNISLNKTLKLIT